MKVTGQMIVKNEDRFVWFAIMSVLPYVSNMLIYDTGSSDKTREIIATIKSPKIIFEEKGEVTPTELVGLRKEQLVKTDTEFFMLVDGDEVWPRGAIVKIMAEAETMAKKKLAIYTRTRNAVGDVWHYLPEETGRYEFQGRRGHFNTRLFRKVQSLDIRGVYPLETYIYNGRSLNDQDDRLEFVDVWYLHATHLTRSTKVPNPKYKYDLGLEMEKSELPEILAGEVLKRRSLGYEILAGGLEPIRKFKRIIHG